MKPKYREETSSWTMMIARPVKGRERYSEEEETETPTTSTGTEGTTKMKTGNEADLALERVSLRRKQSPRDMALDDLSHVHQHPHHHEHLQEPSPTLWRTIPSPPDTLVCLTSYTQSLWYFCMTQLHCYIVNSPYVTAARSRISVKTG